jgi:hypothetical protein
MDKVRSRDMNVLNHQKYFPGSIISKALVSFELLWKLSPWDQTLLRRFYAILYFYLTRNVHSIAQLFAADIVAGRSCSKDTSVYSIFGLKNPYSWGICLGYLGCPYQQIRHFIIITHAFFLFLRNKYCSNSFLWFSHFK